MPLEIIDHIVKEVSGLTQRLLFFVMRHHEILLNDLVLKMRVFLALSGWAVRKLRLSVGSLRRLELL